ncbi:MAG: LysE family translocator [Rhodospirillaceae bacterium]|nr:LysE family translocator [Rhodospirillaceae bacterium]
MAFLMFAFVAAVTPGPSNVMLTAAGALGGVWRGLPCLAGVSLGMGTLIFAVAMGMGQIVVGEPAILRALNWAGAAFLLWLAWKIATAPVGGGAAQGRPVGLAAAAAFQWINPKAWLVCVSAAGTYLTPGAQGALAQAGWLALLFVAAALPSGFVWLAFGATMQRFLDNARRARIFNLVMGAALAGSVAMILW